MLNPPGLTAIVLAALAALLFGVIGLMAQPAGGQKEVAQLLAGDVELELPPRGSGNWVPIKTGARLILGTSLRVGTNGPATLRFNDTETARFAAGARVILNPPPGRKSGFEALFGRFYFFHRDKPEDFGVNKGRNWMIVRGTEVVLEVSPGAGPMLVNVIEGEVELNNELGRTNVFAGEAGVFESGRSPRRTSMASATSLIQWCLYYPAVIDPAELKLDDATRAALRDSLTAYQKGDLPSAQASYPTGRVPASAGERIYRAALLLSAGQVNEAESLLEQPASSADADPRSDELRAALRMLSSVVRGTTARSMRPGSESPPVNSLASTLLANSYARQAQLDLAAALVLARRALEVSPEFAFAWVRVAELEFGFGRVPSAQRALQRSLELAPRNAQAVALQGFVLAARGSIAGAIEQFERAIALDGALGNAWLGRGLCRIRQGDVGGGRNDLQVAVTLEPNRAAFRSYLGKAFDATGDRPRAFRELELAKDWDPHDPTAWLYSALLKQRENRINDAVRDLEESQRQNDNRRLYRSTVMVEQDRAVRGANLANVYADAGLGEVAFREAMRSVNLDYANASAHRFLANSYATLNPLGQSDLRYETPQANEFLVSKLLAPVGAGPLSQFVSFQEYGRLLERDGFHVASSTEYLSRGAWTQSGAQYGTVDRFAYSLDAFYQSDPGQRRNQDLDLLSLSAQAKIQVTPQDSFFTQIIHTRADAGDLNRYFDSSQANPFVRLRERQEPLFLAGYHREWSPAHHTLFLFGRVNDILEVQNPIQNAFLFERSANSTNVYPFVVSNRYQSELTLYSAELQQIFTRPKDTFVVGGRFQSGRFETRSASPITENVVVESDNGPVEFRADAFDNPNQRSQTDLERWSAYGYWHRQIFEPLRLTAGLSYDYLRSPVNHRFAPISDRQQTDDLLAPKAGLIWTPHADMTVRAGYSQAMGGVSLDQSFQLEPSQVGGFNQSWRSIIPESVAGSGVAPRFETWGMAWDHKLGSNTYLGASGQWLRSEMRREIGVYDIEPPADAFNPVYIFQSGTPQRFHYDEQTLAVSVHQLAGRDWSYGARYRLSYANLRTVLSGVPNTLNASSPFHREEEVSALLHQVGLYLWYNHPCGFFGQLDTLWTSQDNDGYSPNRPGDDFWQFNALAGYRFPRRHAEIRVGVLNLFDRDYRLNPLNLTAEPPRERTFYAAFRFSF